MPPALYQHVGNEQARVSAEASTLNQTLALRQDALTETGCERLFTDTASGSLSE